MNPIEHIKKIQEDLDGSKRIKESLLNAIKALSNELYSKDTHFIFELIQNAEDNSYKPDVEPSLTFRLLKNDFIKANNSDGILIIENNEIGFKEENVDALCKVGGSTKKKSEGYIGEKGIGFKSVFKISSSPQIYSNGYSFILPEKDKKSNLGYIFPRWIDNIPELIDKSKTTILLPLDKEDYSFQKISSFLKDIDIESILFLSKLSELKIEIEGEYPISMIKDSLEFPFVELLSESKGDEILVDKYFIIKKGIIKPEYVYSEKRKDVLEREITIALPLRKSYNQNKLFAYLPVEENTGLPFIINADFLLTSSREGIKVDESWNKWLRNCITDVFVKGFEKGLLNKDIREKLYEFIPMQSNIEFLEPVVSKIQDKLKNVKSIISAPDNNLILPTNARFASKEFRTLLKDNYPEALLEDTRIVLPSLEKYKKQLQQIEVIQIEKEEIKEVFADKDWVELHNSNWLLNSFKYLKKLRFKKDDLSGLSLVPILKNKEGELTLSSNNIQPIYFECIADVEDSLSKISSKVTPKIEFIEKDFFTLIKNDESIKEWMTEVLCVDNFSKENYSIDLYKCFINKYHILTDDDFISLSFTIIEFAEEDADYPEFPLLLENNKGKIKKDDLKQMPNIQSIVTPKNYDKDEGWQNIWRTEEDRKHIAILSNKYLIKEKENVFRKFTKINNIKEFPLPFYVENINYWNGNEFEKSISDKIYSTRSEAISNYRPVNFLTNINQLDEKEKKIFSKSLIKWLQNNNKYLSNFFSKNDWEQSIVKYFYRTYKEKAYESEFLSCLKKNKWIKTTKGFIKPSEAFIEKQYIKEIFGDSLPYIDFDLHKKIEDLLEINNDISFDKVIELLENQKNKENIDLSLIKKIYGYLDTLHDSEKTKNKFINSKLIFVPNNGDANWFTSKEIFWSDKSDVFGDSFPYLEKYYTKLKSFFLEKLKINDDIDSEKYAQQWIKLQEQENISNNKTEKSLTSIYKELLPLFKVPNKPSWWNQFIEEAQIWTQNNLFVNPEDVYVSDDIELKSAFKNGKLNLVWRPKDYTNSDLESFYDAFHIKYLSKEVRISIYQKGNEKISNEQFLTKPSKILILSWLYNKQENSYNRICENNLFDSLIKTKEIITDVLKVCYELQSIQVIKERDSFFFQKENKLFYISTKETDDLKNSMAQNIARTLLPTQNYKDFADFIELVLSSTNWKKRQEQKGFKLPNDLKEWLGGDEPLKKEEKTNPKKSINDKQDNNNNNKSKNTNKTNDLTNLENNNKIPISSDKIDSSTNANRKESQYDDVKKNIEIREKNNNRQSQENSQANSKDEPAMNKNKSNNKNTNNNDNTFNPINELNNAFNKPNRYTSTSNFEDDGRVTNPERRSENNWNSLHNNLKNEPHQNERYKRKNRKIFEEPNKQVKEFLRQLYNGKCQICGKTFKKRNDGNNYFNSVYLIPRKRARQVDLTANALCLCPEHFAKFHYASMEAEPHFVEQIRSLKISAEGGNGNLSINLKLAGENCKITYKEKHLKDLQDMIEFYSERERNEQRTSPNLNIININKEKPKVLTEANEINKKKTMKSELGIIPKDIDLKIIKKMYVWSSKRQVLPYDLQHKLELIINGSVPFEKYYLIVINCLDILVKNGITKEDLNLR